MGNLTHTVGGTDNLVNFKSAARVPIDSLKVHFNPIQEGEGDPSPSNVRPISGWDGIEQFYSGKNIAHIIGFSTSTTRYPGYNRYLSNNYGTTINTINFIGPDTSLIVTQEVQEIDYYDTSIYKNGYFTIEIDNLLFNHSYIVSFKINNILTNSFNREILHIKIANPNGSRYSPTKIEGDRVYFNYTHKQYLNQPQQQCITVYNCGMSFTVSEFMITETNEINQEYEPYTQKRFVNWNQWLKPLTDENWRAYNSNYTDVTFEDGIATSTWLTNNIGYLTSVITKVGILQKSKDIWYISYMIKTSKNNSKWGVEFNGGIQTTPIDNLEANVWDRCSDQAIFWRGTCNYVYISNYKDSTDNDHIGMTAQVKSPIFINLTQMFGPGNEPTKEEFEEQCVLNGIDLTSALPYDEGSVREWKTNGTLLKNTITFPVLGKNKFNIDAPFAEPNNTTAVTSTLRIFQPYTYCLGLDGSNYYNPSMITNFSNSNNTITFTSSHKNYGVAFSIPLLYGTYRLSYTGENISFKFIKYDSSGQIIYDGMTQTDNNTFSIGKNVAITTIIFMPVTANTPSTISNIQIEEGITATEYEEFNSNHIVYGGYVDLANGELVATHRKITLTGYEDVQYTVYSTSIYSVSNYFFGDAININSQYILGLCSHTSTSSSGRINSPLRKAYHTHGIQFYNAQSYWGLSEVSVDALIAKLKEWYNNGTPLEIVYELAEPIHYSLTPNQLTTFLNQNNFWSNTNGPTEISYAIHDSEQIRSARKRIFAAAPKLEEASGSIATFNTDISAPLKECKAYFEPIQDLHGYSNPWFAGGGKNIAKPYDNNYVSSTYISFDYSASAGTFHCSGSASASSSHSSPSVSNAISNNATFTLPADTYTLSIIDGDGTYIYAQCVSSTETVLAETTSQISFTTNEALTVFVRLKVAAGATVDNTVKIQLEKGSTATSYEPYENICPIEGWDELELYLRGVNFQDEIWEVGQIDNTTGQQKTSTDSILTTNYLPVPINTDLRVVVPENTSVKVAAYDRNKQYLDYLWRDYQNLNYTRKLNQCYLKLQMRSTYGTTYNNDISINYPITESAYKPYQGQTIPITFPSEAGTIYGGYVDLVKGEVVQEWAYNTLSNLSVSLTSNSTTAWHNWQVFTNGGLTDFSTSSCPIICDRFIATPQSGGLLTQNQSLPIVWMSAVDGSLRFKSQEYCTLTAAEFKETFADMKVCYKLKNPIIYSLTPQQLKTLRGTNNIWSNANENIQIKYWTH